MASQYAGFPGLGHSICLFTIEPPFPDGRDEKVLQSGMIFTPEVALLTDHRFFGSERVVLVTKSGWELLPPDELPYEF